METEKLNEKNKQTERTKLNKNLMFVQFCSFSFVCSVLFVQFCSFSFVHSVLFIQFRLRSVSFLFQFFF